MYSIIGRGGGLVWFWVKAPKRCTFIHIDIFKVIKSKRVLTSYWTFSTIFLLGSATYSNNGNVLQLRYS